MRPASTALFFSTVLFLASAAEASRGTCITNNSTITDIAIIGSSVTVNLSGTVIGGWEVTYNGVTTGLPDTSTQFELNSIRGDLNVVRVVAQGGFNDMTKENCDDVPLDIVLDYAPPVCGLASQSPDSTVTPVDIGTVLTLTQASSGATSALVNGVPATPTSGVPNEDNAVTWEVSYTAVADENGNFVLSNPDAEMAQCSFTVDVNCEDPTIADVAPPTESGVTVSGTPDCSYTLRVSNAGSSTDYTVVMGGDGTGELAIPVPYDTLFEVGQLSLPEVTDSFMTPPAPTVTIPTMGELGIAGMIALLVTGGLLIIRRSAV